jgi:hypothetical protein
MISTRNEATGFSIQMRHINYDFLITVEIQNWQKRDFIESTRILQKINSNKLFHSLYTN